MNPIEQYKDNLFSANHRNKMISRNGYTDAMSVTVGELVERVEIENAADLQEAHECTIDLKGYCNGCEEIARVLNQFEA
jgi:propanediol dehydratase large subunit